MIVGKRISIVRLWKIIWMRLLMIAFLALMTVGPLIHFKMTHYAIDRSIPLIVGTAIAIFLGFRTNSAYERWWEARKIWGSVLNDSLNLGRLSRDLIGLDSPESQELVRTICHRQAAWAYALDHNLKGLPVNDGLNSLLDPADFNRIKNSVDPPLELLLLQGNSVRSALRSGIIDTFQSNALQETLTELTNHMGGCGRIRNTQFPIHYSYFTQVFIWIFLLLLGFSLPSYDAFDSTIHESASYIAIPAIVLIGWVFFMVDGIAQYMQSPFENNRNVIPMTTLSRKIEIGLRMTLGESELPPSIQPDDDVLW